MILQHGQNDSNHKRICQLSNADINRLIYSSNISPKLRLMINNVPVSGYILILITTTHKWLEYDNNFI